MAEVLAMLKRCPKCTVTKSLFEFTTGQSRCNVCRIEDQKIRKDRDPTIYRRIEWPSKLKRLYGLSVDDYYKILADQGGGCAICKDKVPKGRKYVREGTPMFNVDHCHATGKVRGLLCTPCNRALGLLQDDVTRMETMIQYLKESDDE